MGRGGGGWRLVQARGFHDYCEEGLHTARILTVTPRFHAWMKIGGIYLTETDPPPRMQGRLAAVRARTRAQHTTLS